MKKSRSPMKPGAPRPPARKRSSSRLFAGLPVAAVSIGLVLLLGSCSLFQDSGAANLERHIERQRMQQELIAAPAPVEQRSAEQWEEIGDRQLLRGDINRAYLYYLKGLGIEPGRVSILRKQAALLLKKHKFNEAEAVCNKLLAIDSNDSIALEGLGKAQFGQGKFTEAEPHFLAALHIAPDQWQSHEYLGLIFSQRQDFTQAIARFNSALALQPGNVGIANNLAVSHYLSGNFTEALQLLSELAKKSRERKIHNNLALTYFQLGFHEQAMAAFKQGADSEAEAFEKAIDLHPRFYSSAQKNLAIARQEFSRTSSRQN